jgi:hypothetical protein
MIQASLKTSKREEDQRTQEERRTQKDRERGKTKKMKNPSNKGERNKRENFEIRIP